ncbi:hypothetical protein AMK32_01305 [Streptomyces sp. CB01883]|nr:hypothetical protein AMK32_01305 [Streptomyces sp. CB01883]
MTPWLRLMLRRVRLLLVITAALPLFGTATAYAATLAQTTGTAPAHGRPGRDGSYGPGHGIPDRPGRPQPDRAGRGLPARGSPAVGPWAPATPSGPASPSAPDAAPVSRFSPSSHAAEPSRAGSRAGEGRMRPGRPDGPAAEVEGDDTMPSRAAETAADQPEEPETADVPGVPPGASPPPEEAGLQPAQPPRQPAGRQAASEGEGTTEPVLQILPLGSGLVLIGLGLGLALLGLRLRRL